jgi:hypothetical protein
MEQKNGRIVGSPVEARQGASWVDRCRLFWWSAARLLSSHSRFRSLAFLGTLNWAIAGHVSPKVGVL